jgi:hypothetical protein
MSSKIDFGYLRDLDGSVLKVTFFGTDLEETEAGVDWLSPNYRCWIDVEFTVTDHDEPITLAVPSVEHGFHLKKVLLPYKEFMTLYGEMIELEADDAFDCSNSVDGTRFENNGVSDLKRKDWNSVSRGFMEELNMIKYRTFGSLRDLLLATGNAQLRKVDPEADKYSGFWCCATVIKGADGELAAPVVPDGEGANVLGVILMKVRARIAEELKTQC